MATRRQVQGDPARGRRGMARVRLFLRLAVSDGIPRRSFYAAVVVGIVLNLINQGDVLWGDAAPNYIKVTLTVCVPYCVATYGAVMARMNAAAGEDD